MGGYAGSGEFKKRISFFRIPIDVIFFMLVIIDFDGVLFDDARFKKEWESLFRRAGISRGIYEKTYQESKRKGYYDARLHVKLAYGSEAKKSFSQKYFYDSVMRCAEQSFRFVYKDAKPFLKFLRTKRVKTVLLSTGDSHFQKRKIMQSGLADFFTRVMIIRDVSKLKKMHAITGKKRDRVIFIDDKKRVVEEIKKSLPQIYVVQMRRQRNQESAAHVDARVRNFSEVKRLLLGGLKHDTMAG